MEFCSFHSYISEMVKPRSKESVGSCEVLAFSECMLAYNKLGRLVSSPVVGAGNKVKDIDMQMKIAQLPDKEETLLGYFCGHGPT